MLNSDNWKEEREMLLKQRGIKSYSYKLGQRPFAKFSDVQDLALTIASNTEMRGLFLEVERLRDKGVPDDDERFMDIGSQWGHFIEWYHVKKSLDCPTLYLHPAIHLARCSILESLDLCDRIAVSEALKNKRAGFSEYIDLLE